MPCSLSPSGSTDENPVVTASEPDDANVHAGSERRADVHDPSERAPVGSTDRRLEHQYEAAWTEWEAAGEEAVWRTAATDGLDESVR